MESQVRDYVPADYEAVRALHESSGIDYTLPDLDSPLFVVTKVVERAGRIVACAGARIEAELYLWMSHDVGTPEERWEDLRKLNVEMLDAAWFIGLNNFVCWVPEGIEKSFAKRLTDLGFSRDRSGWHSWSRETKQKCSNDISSTQPLT